MRPITIAIVLLGISLPTSTLGEHAVQIVDVEAAANDWLSLIDDGAYEESWHQAAPLLRELLPMSQWAETLSDVRAPLGDVKSRALRGARSQQSPPGLPDGEYVMLRFESQFEHRARAIETLTLVRQGRSGWRAAGYFVH